MYLFCGKVWELFNNLACFIYSSEPYSYTCVIVIRCNCIIVYYAVMLSNSVCACPFIVTFSYCICHPCLCMPIQVPYCHLSVIVSVTALSLVFPLMSACLSLSGRLYLFALKSCLDCNLAVRLNKLLLYYLFCERRTARCASPPHGSQTAITLMRITQA